MAKVWHAREAVIRIDASADIAIPAGAALDTVFGGGTVITADLKGVEITEPEMAVDKIDLIGIDGNSFQNAEVELKPAGMAKISGTFLLRGDETGFELEGYETSGAIGGTHTRYQRDGGTRKTPSFLVNLDDSTDEVNIVLHECYVTSFERKLTGADGHWEVTFEAMCLPKNFYVEFKN
mgnify:CR=1 FL=1|jgi:hypothetical protein|tara:strand:- start:14065 stop:14601 length:537 start_codon:yes stop_codon:yes gene_type:complete